MGDHYNIVKVLINNGINVEQSDIKGHTPIFYTITYRAYKTLKILAKFCDLNKKE
jgi:hypothetical protein